MNTGNTKSGKNTYGHPHSLSALQFVTSRIANARGKLMGESCRCGLMKWSLQSGRCTHKISACGNFFGSCTFSDRHHYQTLPNRLLHYCQKVSSQYQLRWNVPPCNTSSANKGRVANWGEHPAAIGTWRQQTAFQTHCACIVNTFFQAPAPHGKLSQERHRWTWLDGRLCLGAVTAEWLQNAIFWLAFNLCNKRKQQRKRTFRKMVTIV